MRDVTLYEEPIRRNSPSDEQLEIFHGYEAAVYTKKGHPYNCRCNICKGKKRLDDRAQLRRQKKKATQSYELDREIAPAVVAAGAAVGTLGYTIVKDFFNSGSQKDVTWKLKRMDGTKFPNDEKTICQDSRGYREKTILVKGSFEAGYIDEISASFEVIFSYNGCAVSNIYVQNTGINDAVGWDLVVNQDIRRVDQVFYIGSRPISAVDIKFHFHFSSPLTDKILLIDYRVYGNGYKKRLRYRWS